MEHSSKSMKFLLDKVFDLHNEEKSCLQKEMNFLKQNNATLQLEIKKMKKNYLDDEKVEVLQKEIQGLKQTKYHLVQEVNQLKRSQDTTLSLNKTMFNEIETLKRELEISKIHKHQMEQKLLQERKRVMGWKQRALNERSSSISENRNGNHVLERNKTTVDVYAPMTEQFPDEAEASFGDDDDLVTSVGETEHFPRDKITVDSDSDKDSLGSPSIISNIQGASTEFTRPKVPVTFADTSSMKFETSDDLFADAISPVAYKTTKYKINMNHKEKIEACFKDKKKIEFTSSTPVCTVNKIDLPKPVLQDEGEVKPHKFKYVEVVRKKTDREKLNGYTCHECENFYANENLSHTQRKAILDRCSRHRHVSTPPPSTPDEFWEVGFPSTQEYMNKGLLDVGKGKTQAKESRLGTERQRKRIKYQ